MIPTAQGDFVLVLDNCGSGGTVGLHLGSVIRLAVVTQLPSDVVGEGSVRIATPTVSGGLVTSGASIPAIMPYLDGIN